jgi:hypothetical protein
MELHEMNCLGAGPMKATPFPTLSYHSNIWSSARTAAIVVSPILRNRFEKVLFFREVRIILDESRNLPFQSVDLRIEIGDMFPYRVFNGCMSRAKVVKLLGTDIDQGVDPPHQCLECTDLGRCWYPGFTDAWCGRSGL